MKIEVGKEYRRRDGKKAKCVHEFKNAKKYPYVIVGDDFFDSYNCTSIGEVHTGIDPGLDLISPWEEPKPRLKAWIALIGPTSGIYFSRFDTESPGDDFIRAPWLDERPEESKC